MLKSDRIFSLVDYLKFGFSTDNALLKLDRKVLSWIFLGRLFHMFKLLRYCETTVIVGSV